MTFNGVLTMKTAMLSLSLLFAGCFHMLTPTELSDRGTRVFKKVAVSRATNACAEALETLGYKVTVKALEVGMVTTAPKVIMVSASGGNGYAAMTEDALSWSVNVKTKGNVLRVHAVPRGFRNGSDISQRGMPDVVIDPKFNDLWNELASTLGPAEREQLEDTSND